MVTSIYKPLSQNPQSNLIKTNSQYWGHDITASLTAHSVCQHDKSLWLVPPEVSNKWQANSCYGYSEPREKIGALTYMISTVIKICLAPQHWSCCEPVLSACHSAGTWVVPALCFGCWLGLFKQGLGQLPSLPLQNSLSLRWVLFPVDWIVWLNCKEN